MGATLRAPIASSPQMSGLVGIASNPDVKVDVEVGFGPVLLSSLKAGSKVQPTRPPHPLLEIETCTYPEVSGTTMGDDDTPDRLYADIGDIISH